MAEQDGTSASDLSELELQLAAVGLFLAVELRGNSLVVAGEVD